jgi:hypothetical protein
MSSNITIKERPILFKADMVRAIIALLKDQTRRLNGLEFVNENPGCWQRQWVPAKDGKHWLFTCGDDAVQLRCPYGVEGDRLWVRETCRAEEAPHGIDGLRYIADAFWQPIENTAEAARQWVKMYNYGQRRGSTVPPIHMPRWASRLLLEITAVRCERLQDISEGDAVAEGVERVFCPTTGTVPAKKWKNYLGRAYQDGMNLNYPIESYFSLWNSINGTDAHLVNPWVWVVEFKLVQPTTCATLTTPDTAADVTRAGQLIGQVKCINIARASQPQAVRWFGQNADRTASGKAHESQAQAVADVVAWADGKEVASA